ncbi:MAG: DUF2809 domain-containing protein [Fibrobacterota bacterium]|nr:DUF2809 domain-containing protein [Fibrobacterota bacterium]QQS05264.1 MAG: DUF2809 domain-containing protein [Fibrobacterota bacterium]
MTFLAFRSMFRFSIPWAIFAFALFALEVFIGAKVHDNFVRPYLGDVLVVILVHAIVRTFVTIPWRPVLVGVVLFAFAVEGMQAIHLGDLLGLRPGSIAAIVLGSQADLKDLLCYLAGALVVFGLEWLLEERQAKASR